MNDLIKKLDRMIFVCAVVAAFCFGALAGLHIHDAQVSRDRLPEPLELFGATGIAADGGKRDCGRIADEIDCWAHDAGYPVFYDGGCWTYDGQVFRSESALQAWKTYATDSPPPHRNALPGDPGPTDAKARREQGYDQ